MSENINAKRGSMTLEASIALPLFLCVIISVIFLIKLTYTHELVQHAIEEAAWEIASSAYIYQASGLSEICDTAQESAENSTGRLKGNIRDILGNLDVLGDSSETAGNVIDAAVELFAEGAFYSIKSEIFAPVVRNYVEKYIAPGYDETTLSDACSRADKRLKLLNVKNGILGMDFSKSSFLENKDENVEIVVSYEIELPLPINILPDLKVVQSASSRAWLSGDKPAENGRTDDIWSLGNLERGAKIRALFGANLPFSFPVISSFENGTAIMIKSMDLTAESYQNTLNVRKEIEVYINELVKFKGQEAPWGSKKIVISNRDILNRQILLVIPQNELLPEIERVLEACIDAAAGKDIKLKIVRYGIKQTKAP